MIHHACFITLLAASPLAAAAPDAAALRADMQFFTGPCCSRLRPELGRENLSRFRSPLLAQAAAAMLAESYDTTHRAAAYQAYLPPRELGRRPSPSIPPLAG